MSESEKTLTREEFVAKQVNEAKADAAKKNQVLSAEGIEKATDSANREYNVVEKQRELDAINAKRTGKGTRLSVGQTRGKNPQIVVWEAFDESQPETLPKTVAEFLELTKIDSEPVYLLMLIDGYNSTQYTAASDPIAEYLNPAWNEDMQKQFRTAIKNYTLLMQGVNPAYTLDEAVTLLKPSIEAGFAALLKQA